MLTLVAHLAISREMKNEAFLLINFSASILFMQFKNQSSTQKTRKRYKENSTN